MSRAFYVKIGGLHGGATGGRIAALSFAYGISRAQAHPVGGMGHGRAEFAEFKDITITKAWDESLAALFLACAEGTRFEEVTFDFEPAAAGKAAHTITLHDVVVGSFTPLNASVDELNEHGEQLIERVTFSYSRIALRVAGRPAGWDLGANRRM